VQKVKENAMARRCKLSKKKPLVGMNVSHSHIRTKMVQVPNLQVKRIYLPEESRWVRVRLTARALRTVTKKGLLQFVKDEGLRLEDVIH
jgi:large subunit ribosomal protein L28